MTERQNHLLLTAAIFSGDTHMMSITISSPFLAINYLSNEFFSCIKPITYATKTQFCTSPEFSPGRRNSLLISIRFI
jgi:hypothetical protein